MRLAFAIRFMSSAAMAMAWVFIPIYANDLGIDAFVIGLIVAANALAVLLSSWVFGRAADMHGRRRFIVAGLLGAVVAFALLSTATSAMELIAFRFTCGLFDGMFNSSLVAYVAERRGSLGRFTSFGPLGMTAGFLFAGSIMATDRPTNTIFLASAGTLALTFCLALGLPQVRETTFRIPRIPLEIIRRNGHLYLAMLLRHTGASMAWVIFPLYEQSMGLSRALIAYIWIPNFMMQVVLMNFADRMKNSHVMVICGLASTAGSFAIWIAFQEWYGLVPGMFMIGIAWAFLYMGSIFELMENNEERATATGLLNSSTSLSGIVGPIMGGIVAAQYGYVGNLYGALALTCAALVLYLMIAPQTARNRRHRTALVKGGQSGINS